ncbi:MAG: DUF5031 domain-containing protein [Bacteroides sp.]|nr:DUF5031 domain-containing protein [Bacteroides sp.]
MKRINTAYLVYLLSMFFCVITSCSDNNDKNDIIEDGLPITATIDTRVIPTDLTCKMYVFWKSTNLGDTEYECKETIVLDNQSPYRMKFHNNELINKNFRFFFMAVPKTDSKLNIYNSDDQSFAEGDLWSELIIRAEEKELIQDYYHGFVDKTSEEIMNTNTIQCELERILGQIVLDVYRINGNDINAPMPIQSEYVSSVLDRVYQIDIQYSGLTKEIGFDEDGNIIEKSSWDSSLNHTITPTMTVVTGDTIHVQLPQSEIGLEVSGKKVNGSARIKGTCSLTSSPKVKVKYEFKYYDTTPICGNNDGGNHTLDCYKQKSLVLNIPQESETENLLSIIPNNYTVNKAGIRLDRIIDLGVYTSLELVTAWGNEESNN